MPTKAVSDIDRILAWAATASVDEVTKGLSSANAILRKRVPLKKKAPTRKPANGSTTVEAGEITQ